MNYEDKIQASILRIQIAAHIAERHGEPMTVCFSGGNDAVTSTFARRNQ